MGVYFNICQQVWSFYNCFLKIHFSGNFSRGDLSPLLVYSVYFRLDPFPLEIIKKKKFKKTCQTVEALI